MYVYDHAVIGPTANALDTTHRLFLVLITLYVHPTGSEVVSDDSSHVVLLGDVNHSTTKLTTLSYRTQGMCF